MGTTDARPRCKSSVEMPDVDALLVAAGRGDLHAFALFYDQTVGLIYRMTTAKGLTPERAEHIANAVYTHAWRTAPLYDPGRISAVATLVTTTLRHLRGAVISTTAVDANVSGNTPDQHLE